MRHLYCKKCGKRTNVKSGMLFPRSNIGEPAEYGRVIKGIAKTPQASQRVVYMNDSPFPLPKSNYNCDFCGTDINPGDEATCFTVWTENQKEPPAWEHEFVEVSK